LFWNLLVRYGMEGHGIMQTELRSRSRSRRFLDGVRVAFLTTLGVRVGFFCPTTTPDVQWDHFSNHTLELGIPVEMVQFILKLLLKQRFLAVHHDFHWFQQQPNVIPFMLKSRKFWKGRSWSRIPISYLQLRNPACMFIFQQNRHQQCTSLHSPGAPPSASGYASVTQQWDHEVSACMFAATMSEILRLVAKWNERNAVVSYYCGKHVKLTGQQLLRTFRLIRDISNKKNNPKVWGWKSCQH